MSDAEVTRPESRTGRMLRELERVKRLQRTYAIALVVAGVIEVVAAGALTWSSCGHGGAEGGQRR
jgi:hypothetical protein